MPVTVLSAGQTRERSHGRFHCGHRVHCGHRADPGEPVMIVAMAGLPGAGKSTLAHALAARVDAVVLNKDQVRATLFPPSRVEYSRAQDDFCLDVMYRTARWLLCRDRSTVVILDGSTYTRAYRVAALRELAGDLGVPLRIIECTCAAGIARARIDADRATGSHPAGNRDPELYRDLQSCADPIRGPKLVVDTARPLDACVADCLRYLAASPTSPKSTADSTGSG